VTTEELTRTEVARGDLSPRSTLRACLQALGDAQETLWGALLWDTPADLGKRVLEHAANRAQLAADLLRAMAEKAT